MSDIYKEFPGLVTLYKLHGKRGELHCSEDADITLLVFKEDGTDILYVIQERFHNIPKSYDALLAENAKLREALGIIAVYAFEPNQSLTYVRRMELIMQTIKSALERKWEMKYRKKPIVIEAMQLTRMYSDLAVKFVGENNIEDFCLGEFAEDSCYIDIKTLEGCMRASEFDWIIKGIKGEIYPCKPDIFEATYEQVNTAEKGSAE